MLATLALCVVVNAIDRELPDEVYLANILRSALALTPVSLQNIQSIRSTPGWLTVTWN